MHTRSLACFEPESATALVGDNLRVRVVIIAVLGAALPTVRLSVCLFMVVDYCSWPLCPDWPTGDT